jgi:hypothetical protein
LTLADTNRQYTTNAIQITGSRKAYNERMQSPMGSLRDIMRQTCRLSD